MISASLTQYYGNADIVDQSLIQYYGDAAHITAMLVQYYEDAYQVTSTLEQPYSYPAVLTAILEQRYSIAAVELTQVCEQIYDLATNDNVLVELSQPYSIISGEPTLNSYNIGLQVGGNPKTFTHINIEATRDQYCVSGEARLGSQADYATCFVRDDVTITIDGVPVNLFVESKSRKRGHGTAEYTISLLSKTALLDKPYADPISTELSGFASQIVASLASGYTVNWNTVDWYIPANTLLPSDQSPLEIIRQIAAAAGAVIQTELDGAITIEPAYPVRVPDWDTVTPAYSLTDAEDFFTTGEDFVHRDGYNVYNIGDQLSSGKTFTPESEDLDEYRKYVKAYKVPWNDDFTIRHTGDSWVTIETVGIETEVIEETVEFVGGAGATSKPICEINDQEWAKANLGTVTHAEDGAMTVAVAAESLLKISYTTKYKKFLVTDYKNESVQVVFDGDGNVLATIVIEFGTGTNADDSLVVIALDDEFNTDEDGNVKTSFEPGDTPGFTVHYDSRAVRIDSVQCSVGMVVSRGNVSRENTQQLSWTNNTDSQTLPHIPQGAVSWKWFGTTGEVQQTERQLVSTGDIPAIGKATYSYSANGYTLLHPALTLEAGESFPVLVSVQMEQAW